MAVALILFTQGANTDVAGKAVLGEVAEPVTVTNGNNAGVVSWKIYLLDAPSESATFPAASQPQILAQAVDNTPTVVFTPDVPGTYRCMLEVTDGTGAVDRDIRCFGVPDFYGFVKPPYQQNPEPLPVALPGLITAEPRPIKPDEQNYGSNVRGWAGNGGASQLDSFFQKHADLPFQTVGTTPFTATESQAPLHVVDLTTIGGAATFNLPLSPRVGFVSRVAVQGTGFSVTIAPQGGGAIDGNATLALSAGGVFLVHIGSNQWESLTSVGSGGAAAVVPFSTVRYVDAATTGTSPDGTVANPFPTIQDAIDDMGTTNGTIFVAMGDYSAETITITGLQVQIVGLTNSVIDDFEGPASITSDSTLMLVDIDSVGSVTTLSSASLVNTSVTTSLAVDETAYLSSSDRTVSIVGAVCGQIVAAKCTFDALTVDDFIQADQCTFTGAITIVNQTDTSRLLSCEFEGVGIQCTSPVNAPLVTFDSYSFANFTRNAWSFAGYGGGGSPALITKTLPLNRVCYVDNSLSNSVAGFIKDGTIANPFELIQVAIQSLASGGVIYLCPGDYTAETLSIFGKAIELIALTGAPFSALPYLPDITTDSLLTLTNIGQSAGNITSSSVLYVNNCRIDGVIQASSLIAVARVDLVNLCLLNAVSCSTSVVIDGYSVQSTVTAGGDLRLNEATVVGTVTAGAGFTACDCIFGANIDMTSGSPAIATLTNCEFTTAAVVTFTTAGGLLRVDPRTYRSMLDQGVTVVDGSIDVLQSGPALQTVGGWDASTPEVVTVLPAGHAAGVYLVTGVAVITDAADTGTLSRTIDWASPTLGADSSVLGSIAATATGSAFQDATVIVSTGAADVTVTFAGSSITGSLAADLYVAATLQGAIVA